MNIHNKITLIFLVLTGSLMSVVFVIIYFFSNNYTDSEFFDRLNDRANIVAQIHLEKDELSAQLYDEIRKKYGQSLPNEKEVIFRISDIEHPTLPEESIRKDLPFEFFYDLFQKKSASLKNETTYVKGIIYTDNEGDFVVIISADNIFGHAKMKNLRTILIVALMISLIALFLIGRYYAGRVLDPISHITNKVKEITATNLHLRLDTNNNKDELAELSNTFNDMLDRLETTFDLQGSFINNASHELKNPLAAILGETELILNRQRTVSEYQSSIRNIEKEAHRLDLLINNLLELAQAGHENKGLLVEPIRLDELVFLSKEKIDRINPKNKVVLDLSKLPENAHSLMIYGNLSLLLVAMINIIDNACKFSENKEVVIRIFSNKDKIEISVIDKGIGIPKEDLTRVLEPLFRSENARGTKGFGVGLSLAHKIVKMHKGIMNIESEYTKGTTVRISFNKEPESK